MAENVYGGVADINLYLKIKSGDDYVLADFPELLPYRWVWFRDNWQFLSKTLVQNLDQAANPSMLKQQIDDLTQYIDLQRHSRENINPFDGREFFYKFYLVWEQVPVESAPISALEQAIIDKEVTRISMFSKNDFVAIKKQIIKLRDQASDLSSGEDDAYNKTFHRSSLPAYLNPTIEDQNNQLQYQNMIKVIDFILANQYSVTSTLVDPFALAKANANNPEIDIQTYQSGNLVRLNYGEDLRGLANRYLGDPDKWIDVAIANGLKPPYIDEVGIRLPLKANGSKNLINISKTDSGGGLNKDKFFINQIVILQSDTQTFPDQRIVINIKEVPVSGELIIELNGEDDLDRYKTAENANIRVFAPNTINSELFILIPSTTPLDEAPSLETPWFLRTSGEDEKRMKVDLALNENMDISFTSSNDLSLSWGMANAIQAIKLKLLIELGELQRHPEFGFVSVLGQTNINPEQTKATMVESLNRQIEADPRFDRIESININYFGSGLEGPAGYAISMEVRLAGSSKTIPISFSVNVS